MTPLEELAVATPRPDALSRRYARRLDPWWGFAIAAWVWATGALMVLFFALLAITRALALRSGSRGAEVVTVILVAVIGASTIVAFRRWRRKRLAAKERLVRDGALVEVVVTGRKGGVSLASGTTLELTGADRQLRCSFDRWVRPGVGDTITVLHHWDVPQVVVFGARGVLRVGHVDHVRRGADLPVMRVHRP